MSCSNLLPYLCSWKEESYDKNENIDLNSFVYTKHKKGSTSANSPCLNCLFDQTMSL